VTTVTGVEYISKIDLTFDYDDCDDYVVKLDVVGVVQ